MSYDLMVFEKTAAPKTKKEFMEWYEELTEWEEDVDYSEIDHASTALKNWYTEMILTFPPMNGSLAPTDEEMDEDEELEVRTTDYSIATNAIYAAFAWSLADEAYETVHQLAIKHDVGFFDISGNNSITLPDGTVIK